MVVSRTSFNGTVQSLRHLRAIEVVLTTRAVLHKTHELKLAAIQLRESLGMQRERFIGKLWKRHPSNATGRPRESLLNHIGA